MYTFERSYQNDPIREKDFPRERHPSIERPYPIFGEIDMAIPEDTKPIKEKKHEKDTSKAPKKKPKANNRKPK